MASNFFVICVAFGSIGRASLLAVTTESSSTSISPNATVAFNADTLKNNTASHRATTSTVASSANIYDTRTSTSKFSSNATELPTTASTLKVATKVINVSDTTKFTNSSVTLSSIITATSKTTVVLTSLEPRSTTEARAFRLPSFLWVGSCSSAAEADKILLSFSQLDGALFELESERKCSLSTSDCVVSCLLRLSRGSLLANRTNLAVNLTLFVDDVCDVPPKCGKFLQGTFAEASTTNGHEAWFFDLNSTSSDAAMHLFEANESLAYDWLSKDLTPDVSVNEWIANAEISHGAVASFVVFALIFGSAALLTAYVYVRKHCLLRLQYTARRLFDSSSRQNNTLVDEEREQSYLFAL